MSSDTYLILFLFFSLTVLGAKKILADWDKDRKVRTAAQDGAVGLIGRVLGSIFKK